MSRKKRPALAALWDLVRRVVDSDGSPLWEDYLHGDRAAPPPITQQRRWYRFEPTGVGFPVWLSFGRGQSGRLVCTGLVAGLDSAAGPVTSSALRGLSIPSMIEAASGGDAWVREVLGDPERTAPKYRNKRRGHPGRAGLPDDHYRTVLAEYEDALRTHPRAPIQELRNRKAIRHLQPLDIRDQPVPEPTVYRWISVAKKRLEGEKS